MIGPTPCALTMVQMKNVMPAIGTTMALAVNRCRLEGGCKIISKVRMNRGELRMERDSKDDIQVASGDLLHFVNREPYGG